MATLLIIIIYITFISIGIPDSLFGAAWPAIYPDFQVPLSSANFVTPIVACGTVISSMFSAIIINKLGTAKVTAFSTLMTAFALLGYSFSGHVWMLCLFSIPLGLGAGAIDTALNNYVALHYKASHMSFLHCFGNIGTCISPYFMGLALSGTAGWRGGYRIMFFFQLVIGMLSLITIPLWNKVSQKPSQAVSITSEEPEVRTLTLKEILVLPSIGVMWCIFFTSCAIEYTCGIWGSTFLVESKFLAVETAAQVTALYYFGMTLGRFLSGVISSTWSSWRIIHVSQCILAVAVLLLLLPFSAKVSAIALFLVGLGNGPIFPNLAHLTPHIYGKDISQSVIGTQMTFSYLGIMLAPALFGLLAQVFGTGLFPFYNLLLFILHIASTLVITRNFNQK